MSNLTYPHRQFEKPRYEAAVSHASPDSLAIDPDIAQRAALLRAGFRVQPFNQNRRRVVEMINETPAPSSSPADSYQVPATAIHVEKPIKVQEVVAETYSIQDMQGVADWVAYLRRQALQRN